MRKSLLLVAVVTLVVTLSAFAQPPKMTRLPSEFLPLSPQWGNDVLIHNREPVGRPSGAGRSNGVAYVAIPDTASNRQLTIYRTTNFGQTWSSYASIGPPQQIVNKVKVIRGANDSIYIFYLSQSIIIYGNIENLASLRQYSVTGIRDFDVAMSSTGGTYLFYDLDANNTIPRAASPDYGATWPQTANVTSAGAFPRIFWNSQGVDTLVLNYYGPVRANDTLRSIIRQARYREVAPGNIASVTFINVDTDTLIERAQYGSAKLGNVVWFFNTKGSAGSQDIQVRVSTDAGVTFGAPINVAALANVDEYWFDFKNYTISDGGLDLVYVADSSGTTSDRLMYAYIRKATPSTISGLERISDRSVASAAAPGYIPTAFEYYDANGEVGVLWVGLNGSQRAVYYDRYNGTPTGVVASNGNVPETYSLKQNYPNPFNPTTTIEFAIPRNEFVTLKVFDVLGREVQTLVAAELAAGSYKVKLHADGMASGVYWYQLRAGSYGETRKLTVMK